MRGFAGRLQRLRQTIVVGEQAAAHAAQRDHAGTRQCGDIHHRGRLESRGVGQRIAQHQAPFCIGVQNLDGLAAHAGDHIARLDGAPVWHVFARRDQAHYIDGRLQLSQRAEGTQHTGSAAHVELHLVHLGRGLDRDTAGVKGDALAHQNDGRLVLGSAVVAQLDETQRLFRALGHRHESAHAQARHLCGAMHLALDAWQLGEGFGRVSQQAGGGMVGRAVAPFPRKLHASHQGHTAVKPVTRAGRIRHAHHTAAQAACLHLGLGGGVHIAHICHGLNSSADGRRRGLARETQHHALGVWRLDGAAQRLQRLARCARRAVTQAHQHHAAGCDGWHLV